MHELVIPTTDELDFRETEIELVGTRLARMFHHLPSGALADVVVKDAEAVADIRDWCIQSHNVFTGFWNDHGTIHALVRRP